MDSTRFNFLTLTCVGLCLCLRGAAAQNVCDSLYAVDGVGNSTVQNIQSDIFPFPAYLLGGETIDNVVIEWNRAAFWSVAQAGVSNLAPRFLALMHVSMYEAWKLNNKSQSVADPAAVVGFAAMTTLKTLLPNGFARFNLLYLQQTVNLTSDQIKLAQFIAKPAISTFVASRVTDGFEDLYRPSPTQAPYGDYVLASNASIGLPYTQYGYTSPIALPENLTKLDWIADFPGPPDLNTSDYTIQLTAVAVYGSFNSTVRSASQTDTASFWADAAYTTGLIGLWNRVLTSTLSRRTSLETTVKIFAQFNAGLNDCVTATFDLKTQFNRWRPITAVRAGSSSVPSDPSWTPLLETPDSPTYPSINGCYAGFASNFLQTFFGRDAVTFTVASERLGTNGQLLPNRVYQSFTQVATEVVQSRYLGGIEFPIDSINGQAVGQEIATYIMANSTLFIG